MWQPTDTYPVIEIWQPMDTYPAKKTHPEAPDYDLWGPDVLVLMETTYGPVRLVARQEAGMWISRCANDPKTFGILDKEPSYWYPIPEVLQDIHSDPKILVSNAKS